MLTVNSANALLNRSIVQQVWLTAQAMSSCGIGSLFLVSRSKPAAFVPCGRCSALQVSVRDAAGFGDLMELDTHLWMMVYSTAS